MTTQKRKCKEHLVIELKRLESGGLVTLTFAARGNAAKEMLQGWKEVKRAFKRRR